MAEEYVDIEVELSDEIVTWLNEESARTGKSIDEIVCKILRESMDGTLDDNVDKLSLIKRNDGEVDEAYVARSLNKSIEDKKPYLIKIGNNFVDVTPESNEQFILGEVLRINFSLDLL